MAGTQLQQDLDTVDAMIQELAGQSSAPQEFIEAELRRSVCRRMVRMHDRELSIGMLEAEKETLEDEYQIYFNTAEFQKGMEPGFWKPVYASCNASIEFFLLENGLEQDLDTIHAALAKENFIIPNENLHEPIRRYLIGIGYLYPQEENVVFHPNFFMAHRFPRRNSIDTSFLTWDLMRGPYGEARTYTHFPDEQLSDSKLWHYWTHLVSIAMGGAGYHDFYGNHTYKEGRMDSKTRKMFEIGRRIVPQRYIELEPRVEPFEWVLPYHR